MYILAMSIFGKTLSMTTYFMDDPNTIHQIKLEQPAVRCIQFLGTFSAKQFSNHFQNVPRFSGELNLQYFSLKQIFLMIFLFMSVSDKKLLKFQFIHFLNSLKYKVDFRSKLIVDAYSSQALSVPNNFQTIFKMSLDFREN